MFYLKISTLLFSKKYNLKLSDNRQCVELVFSKYNLRIIVLNFK